MRCRLEHLGFDLMGSEGPIIPVLVGSASKALAVKDFLWREGFFTACVRPPTVPQGTERLRLSVMATHTQADLGKLVFAMEKAKEKFF